jgi:hypothetical protein
MSIPAPLPDWAADPDDVVDALHVAFGPAPSPLTWTCAGPAAEFAMRSALCGAVQVVDWPSLGVDWAVLARGDTGVVARRSVLDAALAAVAARHRAVRRRADRAARTAAAAAHPDALLVTSLREGRLRSDLALRTDGDLLMTVNRLRELLFRVWSHHATVAAATACGAGAAARRADDAVGFVRSFDTAQPLPLWGTGAETAATVVPDTTDPRRPHADNLRAVAVEIRSLVDELARRCAAAGTFADGVDVADLHWDELPDCVAGRLSAAEIAARVRRRQVSSEQA